MRSPFRTPTAHTPAHGLEEGLDPNQDLQDPQKGFEISSRARELATALAQAGLAGRVRVGVPRPVDSPPRVDTGKTRIPRTAAAGEGSDPPGSLALDPLLGLHAGASTGRALTRPGSLIEIAGARSSGRTALAYRMTSAVTARGELAGWVDLPDALDPRFLRRAGVNLERTLWVRPPTLIAALRAAEILAHTGFALVVLDLEGAPEKGLAKLGASVWTRLLQRLRGARSTLALLGAERVAGSFATLGIETERVGAHFDYGLFEGIESRAAIVRHRTGPVGDAHRFCVFQRPGLAETRLPAGAREARAAWLGSAGAREARAEGLGPSQNAARASIAHG